MNDFEKAMTAAQKRVLTQRAREYIFEALSDKMETEANAVVNAWMKDNKAKVAADLRAVIDEEYERVKKKIKISLHPNIKNY